MSSSKLTDVERPRLGDEIHKHPMSDQVLGTDPKDGLPRPAVSVSLEDTKAPKLEVETFVCMADESQHVALVLAQAGSHFEREGVPLIQVSGSRVEVNGNGQTFIRLTELEAAQWNKAHPLLFPQASVGYVVQVQPIRPQCYHYRRVMTDFDGHTDGNNKAAKSVERVCAAQRGESGEYVSLNNIRVYACEHRLPRDFVSEERLRSFDRKRLEEAQREEETWDPVAALAAQQSE